MRFRYLAAAMLFAATACLPAVADIITYTYTTAVRPGTSQDLVGLFGPAGADLDGDPATIVYTVDLSKGVLQPLSAMATYLYVAPTTNFSLLNVTASITINGHTLTSPPATDTIAQSGYGETRVGGNIVDQSFYVSSANAACFYTCPYVDATLFEFDYFGSDVVIVPLFEYDLAPAKGGGPVDTSIYTYVTTPTVTVVATTPEPSSLLLIGTGTIALARMGRQRFASHKRSKMVPGTETFPDSSV